MVPLDSALIWVLGSRKWEDADNKIVRYHESTSARVERYIKLPQDLVLDADEGIALDAWAVDNKTVWRWTREYGLKELLFLRGYQSKRAATVPGVRPKQEALAARFNDTKGAMHFKLVYNGKFKLRWSGNQMDLSHGVRLQEIE